MALRPPMANASVSTASPSTMKATTPLFTAPCAAAAFPCPRLEFCSAGCDWTPSLGTMTRLGAEVILTGDAVVGRVGGTVVGLVVVVLGVVVVGVVLVVMGLVGVVVEGGGEAVVVVLVVVVLVLGCGFNVVLGAATTTGSDVMEL